MKENENKEQSKTAGAARQGGDTNNKVIGSAVSTAAGEPVATEQAQPYAYEQDNGCDTELIYAAWFAHGLGKMAPDCIYRPLYLEPVAARLAAPTQAKPVDLSGLTRYDIEHDGCGWMRDCIKGDYVKFADVESLLAAPTQVSALQASAAQEVRAVAEALNSCSQQETTAFESWASSERYDMATHPMHWLFLNERTYAARQGWKAALRFAVGQLAPTSTSTAPASMDEKGGAK